MHVAIIGGASTIGSTVAYTIASRDPDVDVTLVDKATGPAWAHATDVAHSVYHTLEAPVSDARSGEYSPPGTVRSVGADETASVDPDVVVLTAAAPRPDDSAAPGDRGAELEANVAIADDVASQLAAIDPVPVIVVTNPIDRITYRLWDRLGWSRHRFIGYSLSETARAAHAIAELRGVDPATVHCPLMGEHGERVVPIFSRTRIAGEAVSLTADERAEVLEFVREIPFRIATERGAAETSRWVTSAGVTRLVRAMKAGGTDAPLCLSVPVDGEYGLDDACISVPVTLNDGGVDVIHEWDLADEEREGLRDAYAAIREDLDAL